MSNAIKNYSSNIVLWEMPEVLNKEISIYALEIIYEMLQDGTENKSLLVDASKLYKLRMDARKVGIEWAKKAPFKKAALYGSNYFIRNLLNLSILASGKIDTIKTFANQNEAIEWLK